MSTAKAMMFCTAGFRPSKEGTDSCALTPGASSTTIADELVSVRQMESEQPIFIGDLCRDEMVTVLLPPPTASGCLERQAVDGTDVESDVT
jgi:hypothetical protein